MNPEIHSMENGKITILAPAKINLYFGVTGMRSDGYHEVETVLQSVNLFDRLTVSASEGNGREVSVLCRELSDVPESENIAYKAAQAYLSAAEEDNIKVEITIEKKIPDGAGFGGGSSDAAAVIIALNTLSGDRFSLAELFEIGATVGADVPFCLHGGCALCEGIGEKLTPAPSAALPLLLVRGNRGISTGALFRSLDLGKKPARTFNPSSAMLNALEQGSPADIAAALQNDLLPAAVGFAPEIDRYIAAMQDAGALGASMTGSGSVVVGIF